MPRDIDISVKRLFRNFFIFQLGLLVVSIALSLFFTGYFKQRLAGQLTAAVREPLMSGDNRQVMISLPNSMAKDFSGVFWQPAGDGQAFDIPAGARNSSALYASRAEIRLYFDEDKIIEAGSLSFFYPRWTPVAWALSAWLLIVLLSLPLAYREKRRLVHEYQLLVDLEIKDSQASLAAQVAHDIRSPLAALGAAARGLEMSGDQRMLVEGAVSRMRGIADDLLERYRAPGAGASPQAAALPRAAVKKMEFCELAGLIGQVLDEKRLQHKDKTGVKLEFKGAPGIKALVEPKELQRLLSNLMNNSVEAFERDGTVSVSLSARDGKVLLEVKDDGKGIPAEILARLGKKGETHGKAGGNGLGLYHARTTVESWGGSFKISSGPGKGAAVLIELPAAEAPAGGRVSVLLDDDMLVHMNWKMAAKAAGVELKAYKKPEELSAGLVGLPKDTPVYIDSELGNAIKGEDLAKDLHEKGYSDITMATGHGPEKFAHLPWLKVTDKEPPFNSVG